MIEIKNQQYIHMNKIKDKNSITCTNKNMKINKNIN